MVSGLRGVWLVAEMSPPRLEDCTETWLGLAWWWKRGLRGLRLLRGELGSGIAAAVRFEVLR